MARVMSFGGDGVASLRAWFPADWKAALQMAPADRPEFQIGPLSDAKARAINFRHFGHKGEVRTRKGELITDTDRRKGHARSLDEACEVWFDTKNAEFQVGSEPMADLATKVLERAVAIGDWVSFDGHLTDEVKRAILEEGVDGEILMHWILKKSMGLCSIRDAEETELGKT